MEQRLECPGCGATEEAGCVIDLGDLPGDGELIGRRLICVGHERPYWLEEPTMGTDRAASQRLADHVYGQEDAVGDGITDDTAAIQAAIKRATR